MDVRNVARLPTQMLRRVGAIADGVISTAPEFGLRQTKKILAVSERPTK